MQIRALLLAAALTMTGPAQPIIFGASQAQRQTIENVLAELPPIAAHDLIVHISDEMALQHCYSHRACARGYIVLLADNFKKPDLYHEFAHVHHFRLAVSQDPELHNAGRDWLSRSPTEELNLAYKFIWATDRCAFSQLWLDSANDETVHAARLKLLLDHAFITKAQYDKIMELARELVDKPITYKEQLNIREEIAYFVEKAYTEPEIIAQLIRAEKRF